MKTSAGFILSPYPSRTAWQGAPPHDTAGAFGVEHPNAAGHVFPHPSLLPERKVPQTGLNNRQSGTKSGADLRFRDLWNKFIAMPPAQTPSSNAISAFLQIAGEAGFKWHMLVDLPLSLQPGLSSQTVLDNWPEPFRLHYFERRLFLADPALIASYREPGHFFWTDALLKHARTPEQQAVAADLAEAGMKEGLVLPFARGAAWRSIMSLAAADRVRPAAGIVTLLQLAAHHLGACLAASAVPKGVDALSAREVEVLRWLAMGKTALETALILELAKTTVDRHLANARRKLSARTNAHAVALAMGRQFLLES
jgi:DNA-binding CsgD family transcriptional regulator